MEQSTSIKELATALAKAQAELAGAKKDSNNPAFGSKYADLASVVDAIKSAFPKHGLSYVQSPCTTEKDEIGIQTMLMHSSGEWIRGAPYYIPVAKANAHGFGSALTYARRYGLAAMCGIAPEDDDANAAVVEPAKRRHDPARPNTATQVAVDAFNEMPEDEQKFLRDTAMQLIALHDEKGDVVKYLDQTHLDTEEKLALWSLLPSNVRSWIKDQQRAKATA